MKHVLQYKYKCINLLNDDNDIIKNLKKTCDFDSCLYNPTKINTTIKPILINNIGGKSQIQKNENNQVLSNDMESSDLCDSVTDNTDNIDNINNTDDISGGAGNKNIFKKSYVMFMIADATDSSLIKSYFNRLDKLGISENYQDRIKPHISLMEVYINGAHPYHNILVERNGTISPQLKTIMKNQYFMVNPQMYIVSGKGKYEIMGDFLAKVYTALNSNYITHFRVAFYKYIENKLGKGIRKSVIIMGRIFYVYSYGGMDLIAVPSYYHGKGVWKPHLSLAKLDNIKKSNPILYNAYMHQGTKVLINALSGAKGKMNQINMAYHFGSFRITVQHT